MAVTSWSPGIVLIALAMSGAAFADCSPEKLVRIETLNNSPGIPADNFARKPKVMYRLGNLKSRLEEQYDPVDNVQILHVIDWPKAWEIDLASKKGEEMVDTSGVPGTVLSVFSEEELPPEILAVEYGCERQFISDPRTTHERAEMKVGVVMKHSIRSGIWKFTIFTRENSDIPMGAVLSRNDSAIGAILYRSYQILDAVPDGLFAPPAGIAIKKASE